MKKSLCLLALSALLGSTAAFAGRRNEWNSTLTPEELNYVNNTLNAPAQNKTKSLVEQGIYWDPFAESRQNQSSAVSAPRKRLTPEQRAANETRSAERAYTKARSRLPQAEKAATEARTRLQQAKKQERAAEDKVRDAQTKKALDRAIKERASALQRLSLAEAKSKAADAKLEATKAKSKAAEAKLEATKDRNLQVGRNITSGLTAETLSAALDKGTPINLEHAQSQLDKIRRDLKEGGLKGKEATDARERAKESATAPRGGGLKKAPRGGLR
jgi:chromosome segregation ATPase